MRRGKCGDDKADRVWDLASGVSLANLEVHNSAVTSVVFRQYVIHIARGIYDTAARVWDLASGLSLATLKGHSQ